MEPFDYFEELNSCEHLFLEEFEEPRTNSLRIRVIEGRASKVAVPTEVAGQSLGDGFPVRIDAASPRYELTWNSYVLYQVMNESFASQEESKDGVLGSSVCVYRSSTLLDHVLRSSNASDKYPGELLHFRILCEDHIIDIVSTDRPECRRIGPARRVN